MSKSTFNWQIPKRIVFSLIYLVLAFIWPWWLILVIGLILVFYFENFYEYILAGLILDSLYGGLIKIGDFSFIITLFTLLATLAIIKLKQRLLI